MSLAIQVRSQNGSQMEHLKGQNQHDDGGGADLKTQITKPDGCCARSLAPESGYWMAMQTQLLVDAKQGIERFLNRASDYPREIGAQIKSQD